jgi:hypothetical protein
MTEEIEDVEQKTIQPHELGADELRSLLETGETSTSTKEDVSEDAAGEEKEAADAEAKAEAAEKAAAAAEEEAGDGKEKQEDASEEKVTVTKAEYEKLTKQVVEKESFIQRQAAEIGDLRGRRETLETEAKGIKETINTDTMLEDPLKTMEDMKALDNKQIQIEAIKRMEQSLATKEVISRGIPDFEDLIDDIAAIALKDGIPSQNVEVFKRNPYGEPPEMLLTYARRAQEARTYSAEKKRYEELTQQAEAKKKKDGEFLKNIEDAANKKTVTSKTGGTTASKDDTFSKPIHQMTKAELKTALGG